MKVNATKPRIVIVGGGVAGLMLATRLGRSLGRRGHARVVLVDRGPTHVWKPMLHTFAAGTWNVFQQQVQYLAHAHLNHYEYAPGTLKRVDIARSAVRLHPLDMGKTRVAEEREIDFDELILAYGSHANDFNTPGVSQHCHFIDSQQQADRFNTDIRAALARGLVNSKTVEVAIVGGGATGVELAAELSRLVEIAASYDGITHLPNRLRITLLDSSPRILSAFPSDIAESATTQLEALGISIRTGIKVIEADDAGFLLQDGSRIEAEIKVWAAGISALSPGDSALEVNRAGQVLVNENLNARGHRHIYALGDCASLTQPGNEHPLPATAQVANQQALHLAKYLPKYVLNDSEIPPFHFRDLGSLVSLSDYNAFGTLGRFGLFPGGFIQGRFAQLSHAYLYRRHQIHLHGPLRATVLWAAESVNALVQPKIRVS